VTEESVRFVPYSSTEQNHRAKPHNPPQQQHEHQRPRSHKQSHTMTSETTSTSSINPSSSAATKKEVETKALLAQLAATLLELGLTLAASYYFSRWIANKIQGNQNSDHTLDDLGIDSKSGGNVVSLLKRLLTSRHEATLKIMTEELKEHQMQWKQEADAPQTQLDEDKMLLQIKTEEQYAALEDELTLQHQESMSHISNLSTYELSIAQTNVIDPSNLTVKFSDIGGMDQIKAEIYDLVVLPLVRPDLFMSDSGLVSPPKGILLVSSCHLLYALLLY